MTPVEKIRNAITTRKSADGYRAKCPAHDGESVDSLSITEADDDRALICCHSGCTGESVVKAIGLSMSDLMPDDGKQVSRGGKEKSKPKRRFDSAEAALAGYEKYLGKCSGKWDYHNANGELDGMALRWNKPSGKDIRPISRKAGGWYQAAMPEPRPLYQLPALSNATRVYVCEGEKCADIAAAIGLSPATTSSGGAKAPAKTDWAPLAGREVVILRDNDEPGRKYANKVGAILKKHDPATVVRIVELPGLESGGDVADFIELRRGQGESDAAIRDEIEAFVDSTEPVNAEEVQAAVEADKPVRTSQSAASKLLDLLHGVELFHAPGANDGEGYAVISVGGHAETYPVRSKPLKLYLSKLFYQEYGSPPNGEAVGDAINVLAARALFDGAEIPVAVRVAEHGGAIYFDLLNTDWQCARVDQFGWTIVDKPPVRFIRRRGMLPIPIPQHGGCIGDLRELVNVPDDDDWALTTGWAVGAMRAVGPYPVLGVNGEQGSAKTTLVKMFRKLIDPNECPLRAEPREVRDLMIAATNGLVVALDNLSRIQPWLSDCLCRLATGGGFSTRELYSDDSERLFTATRPIILNGIDNVVERPDLLDRALNITLPTIPEDKRRPESELWARFDAMWPLLFGAMLDAVACALRRQSTIKLDKLPRMADFAIWATAAEPALGLADGAIMAAHKLDRAASVGLAIEASPVAVAVEAFTNNRSEDWTGTASELLAALNEATDEKVRRSRDWPKTGRGLGGELRRLAPELRRIGIEVSPPDKGDKTRTWNVTRQSGDSTALNARTALDPDGDSADADSSRAIDRAIEDGRPPDRPGNRPNENPDGDSAAGDQGDQGDSGDCAPTSTDLTWEAA